MLSVTFFFGTNSCRNKSQRLGGREVREEEERREREQWQGRERRKRI